MVSEDWHACPGVILCNHKSKDLFTLVNGKYMFSHSSTFTMSDSQWSKPKRTPGQDVGNLSFEFGLSSLIFLSFTLLIS